jgi:hypothetical protein
MLNCYEPYTKVKECNRSCSKTSENDGDRYILKGPEE